MQGRRKTADRRWQAQSGRTGVNDAGAPLLPSAVILPSQHFSYPSGKPYRNGVGDRFVSVLFPLGYDIKITRIVAVITIPMTAFLDPILLTPIPVMIAPGNLMADMPCTPPMLVIDRHKIGMHGWFSGLK